MGSIRELEYKLYLSSCGVDHEGRQAIVISPKRWIENVHHGAVRLGFIPDIFNLDVFWSTYAGMLRWQKWVYVVKDISMDGLDGLSERQLVGALQATGDNPRRYKPFELSRIEWDRDPLDYLQFAPKRMPGWSSLKARMNIDIDLANLNFPPRPKFQRDPSLELIIPLSSRESPDIYDHLAVVSGFPLDPELARIQLHRMGAGANVGIMELSG